MKKFLILFLFWCAPAFANDIICHDKGKITEKHYSISIDKFNLPDGQGGWLIPSNCLEVSREKFNAITSDDKVDPSIIGSGDEKIVKKSVEELAAEQKAKDDAKKAKDDARQAVIDDLKKTGLKDETIDFILNTRR